MSTVINGIPCVPAEAAAATLGTTPMKILILLREKRVEGLFHCGAWYITEESLAACRKAEPHAAPARCRSGCAGSGCGSH